MHIPTAVLCERAQVAPIEVDDLRIIVQWLGVGGTSTLSQEQLRAAIRRRVEGVRGRDLLPRAVRERLFAQLKRTTLGHLGVASNAAAQAPNRATARALIDGLRRQHAPPRPKAGLPAAVPFQAAFAALNRTPVAEVADFFPLHNLLESTNSDSESFPCAPPRVWPGAQPEVARRVKVAVQLRLHCAGAHVRAMLFFRITHEGTTFLYWPAHATVRVGGAVVERRTERALPVDVTALVKVGLNDVEVSFAAAHASAPLPEHAVVLRSCALDPRARGAGFARMTVTLAGAGAAGDDDDLEVTGQQVPLTCPITLERIQTPARAKACHHPQCFDLMTFLEMVMNSQTPKWACPICSADAHPDSLYIDEKTRQRLLAEPLEQDADGFDDDADCVCVGAKRGAPVKTEGGGKRARGAGTASEDAWDDGVPDVLSVAPPPARRRSPLSLADSPPAPDLLFAADSPPAPASPDLLFAADALCRTCGSSLSSEDLERARRECQCCR